MLSWSYCKFLAGHTQISREQIPALGDNTFSGKTDVENDQRATWDTTKQLFLRF